MGEKLAWLLAHPVPAVSLTFGLPDHGDIAALRRIGSRVLATVTPPGEARLARDAGVDGLVVQGSSASGHSATFDPVRTPRPIPTATHRRALGDPAFIETVLTRAFTGRPARALRNGFVDRHPEGIVGYPAVHHLTRSLRQAAGAAGDADRLHLWAGTGWRSAPTGSAADVVRHLVGD